MAAQRRRICRHRSGRLIAKTAIAEPFYVPSGSMEPTLLIGHALLASKFPYGYSAASLPFGVTTPGNERALGALPQRGDVVVFRWPGKAQTWGVKRVIGLPGDRIAMQAGQLQINGQTAALVADGIGAAESEDGTQIAARRLVETLPGGRQHLIYRLDRSWSPWDFPELMVPAGHLSCSEITATIHSTAVFRSRPAASACCRSATSSVASTRW